MILTLLFLAFSAQPKDCIKSACSVASNMVADLKGEPDMRLWTWGDTAYQVQPITFRPPAGYRVRILRVYGDFLTWPHGKAPEGTAAGVLWGLQTSGPEGSAHADLAADNAMLYVQHATGGKPERAPIDFDVREGGLLEADNVLNSKLAVFLNETGLKIHMEASFVLVFKFEKDCQ